MERLADRVKSERLSQNLSCRQLSILTGVSFSTISRAERGEGGLNPESTEKLEAWLSGVESLPTDEARRIGAAAALAFYEQLLQLMARPK